MKGLARLAAIAILRAAGLGLADVALRTPKSQHKGIKVTVRFFAYIADSRLERVSAGGHRYELAEASAPEARCRLYMHNRSSHPGPVAKLVYQNTLLGYYPTRGKLLTSLGRQ